jgi:hypothetical protein
VEVIDAAVLDAGVALQPLALARQPLADLFLRRKNLHEVTGNTVLGESGHSCTSGDVASYISVWSCLAGK